MTYRQIEQAAETTIAEHKQVLPEKENAVQGDTAVSILTSLGGDPHTQAANLHNHTGGNLSHAGNALLQMQNQFGNRYVQRLINPHQRLTVQPKLMLGDVDTPSEREADQIAGQVVSSSTVTNMPTAVSGTMTPVPPETESAINRAKGGGQPLPENTRSRMEQSLGTDLGGVRVHTDGRADSLSQSLQARAFTTGQDIFFRRNEYNPGSSAGQNLLAHELTHTVQQSAPLIQRKIGFEIETRIPLRNPEGNKSTLDAGEGFAQITNGVSRPVRLDKDEARNKGRKHPIVEFVTGAYDETSKDELQDMSDDVRKLARLTKTAADQLNTTNSNGGYTNVLELTSLGAAASTDYKLGGSTAYTTPERRYKSGRVVPGVIRPVKLLPKDWVDDTAYFQATAGIRLERFKEAFTKAKRLAPTELVKEVREDTKMIVRKMQKKWKKEHNRTPSAGVKNYLIVVAQLLAGHIQVEKNPKLLDKNSQILLPKTSFEGMYDSLRAADQTKMENANWQADVLEVAKAYIENENKDFDGKLLAQEKMTVRKMIEDFIGVGGARPMFAKDDQNNLFGQSNRIDDSRSVTRIGTQMEEVPAFEFRQLVLPGVRIPAKEWDRRVKIFASDIRIINQTIPE